MQIYKVVIGAGAIDDMKHLYDFMMQIKSEEGALCYLNAMQNEINSLRIFADCYKPSSSAVIKQIHKDARRMISHNKKWNYVFHIQNGYVIIDRIIPSSMISILR